MTYPLSTPLLEFLTLSVIARGDSYGYEISQQLKTVSSMKDSSLYPILKRLQENNFVETYDQQYQGRNRRYYHITEAGSRHLQMLLTEWLQYRQSIDDIVMAIAP